MQWGQEERKVAQGHQMAVVENTPCFEALLLDIIGVQANGPSRALKKRFIKECGAEAHKPEVIKQYFSKNILERAKRRVENLQKLINILS
ncbi:MAG: hypothetical protein Q4G54_02095 [Pelistega sp.]|nr:hypothetical protein [Pelistega sp.]